MKRIPFDPKELIPIGEEPGFMPGMPGRPIFPTPITPRENYLMLLSGEVPLDALRHERFHHDDLQAGGKCGPRLRL